MDYGLYRVVFEYENCVFAWRGSAIGSDNARMKVRKALREILGAKGIINVRFHLCEVCYDLDLDEGYHDIRSARVQLHIIARSQERERKEARSPMCLIYLYNRCVEGQEPW